MEKQLLNRVTSNEKKIVDLYHRLKKTEESVITLNPSYKVYTALLTQEGIDAPTAIVLQNTLGNIQFTRVDIGTYNLVLNEAFTLGKTFVIITPTLNVVDLSLINVESGTDNINIQTFNMGIPGLSDDLLNKTSIEIRVYN